MGEQEQQTQLPLTGRPIAIDQSVLPSTELARALDAKENLKRHRVYSTDYMSKRQFQIPKKKTGKPAEDSPK